MRRPDQYTSIDQLECSVRGVKPRKRPIWTPRADNDGQGVHGIDRIRVCAAVHYRQPPTEHEGHPITRAWNRKVSTKSSAVLKIHCRGQSPEKSDRHGGGTSLPIPTGGSAHRVWIGVPTYHAVASIFQLRGGQQN